MRADFYRALGRFEEAVREVLQEVDALRRDFAAGVAQQAAGHNGKKYELMDDAHYIGSRRIYRIRALRDIPEHGVRAGDIGGLVESERNLSQHGGAWIAWGAMAFGKSRVADNALLGGKVRVGGNVQVLGDSRLEGDVRAGGNALIFNAWLGGKAEAGGNSVICNGARLGGNVVVDGKVVVNGVELNSGYHRNEVDWRHVLFRSGVNVPTGFSTR